MKERTYNQLVSNVMKTRWWWNLTDKVLNNFVTIFIVSILWRVGWNYLYIVYVTRTLKNKRTDTAFTSFLNMQRGMTGKPTLEALILAPVSFLFVFETIIWPIIQLKL